MDDNRKKEIVSLMISDLPNPIFNLKELINDESEESFILNTPEVFFMASKLRVIPVYDILKKIRNVFIRCNSEKITLANEAYEECRKAYGTKSLSRERFLALFNLSGTGKLEYSDFCRIESKYITEFNKYVDEKYKIINVNHLNLEKNKTKVDLKDELSKLVTGRARKILLERAAGNTLDTVGENNGVTRERIRQIETKSKFIVQRWAEMQKTQIIEETSGMILVPCSMLYKLFGKEETEIFIYSCQMSKARFTNWYYISELDAMVHSNDNMFYTDIVDIMKSNEGKSVDTVVKQIRVDYPFFTREILDKFCENGLFHISDEKVWKGKVHIGKAILIAAANDFPDGINVKNQKQFKEFVSVLSKYCGKEIIGGNTLLTRVNAVLVFGDKTTYIHPNKIYKCKQLDEEIKTIIASLELDRIPYKKLFEQLSDKSLKEASIDNPYKLSSYVKIFSKDLHVNAIRHYAVKQNMDISSKNYFKSVADWTFEKGRPVSIAEIASDTNWGDRQFKYTVIYFQEVCQWTKDSYFNLRCLSVTNEEKNSIRNMLKEATENKYGYTNMNKMLPLLKRKYSDFLKRNYIEQEAQLFSVLRYMYDGEFAFSKPHVLSDIKVVRYTTMDFLKAIAGNGNTISRSEMDKKIKTYYGDRNSSLSFFLHAFMQDYFKIDDDILINKKKVVVTEKEIAAINQYLSKHVKDKYLFVNSNYDFEGLPKMSFEWNAVTVKEFVKTFDTDYCFAKMKKSGRNKESIICKKDGKFCCYEDVVKDVELQYGKERAAEILKQAKVPLV